MLASGLCALIVDCQFLGGAAYTKNVNNIQIAGTTNARRITDVQPDRISRA